MDCIGELDDPRRASNGTRHDFQEILVISLCAMLSNADSFDDIALWGRIKENWLRRFLVLKNGVPSHDTFDRVFRAVLGGQIAVDGKTLRGSADGGLPVHMVSAFATDLGIALGQEKVSSKSNEITAIPVLLEALYLKGFLVSIDAMGCQKEIAATITGKGGDYLLAVKGNQPSLLEAIETAFIDHKADVVTHDHVETSHGRVVSQLARVLPAMDIVDANIWARCRTIGRIDSYRVVGGKPAELEQRDYISSRALTASELAVAARSHWAVENQLHWVLDVNFGEDASRVRKNNAPQNLSLLKKIVLTLVRNDTTDTAKASLRQKRKRAAWDDDIRMSMLGIQAL